MTGVSQVRVAGQQDFAVHVQVNPAALAARGIGWRTCAPRSPTPPSTRPKGNLENGTRRSRIDTNDQIFDAAGYKNVIVAWRNGAPVRSATSAKSIDGTKSPRTGAWFEGKRASCC